MTRTGNIRNILLIGRTNSGKSTLANVLVNEVDQENKFKNFEQIFKEGEGGAESTTQAIQKDNFEYNGIKYQIIDTIGIGDTKLTPVETIEKLLTMFSEIKGGVNQVFFIVKESFTQEQVFFLDSLADIFFGDDFVKYVTIVKTNAKFFKNEKKCEEDVEKMKGKSTRIDALINNKKIIHVDNKSIPEIDPDDSGNESEIRECQKYRSRSRKIVVNHLAENCQDSCQINSIFDFLNSFKENNELNTESLRKSIKRTEENKSEIDSIVSKFMEDVKKIKESKGNFSSLELSEKSLLAAETVVVVGSAIAASALIGAVVPKTEPVDIVEPICSTLGEMAGERERKKMRRTLGC